MTQPSSESVAAVRPVRRGLVLMSMSLAMFMVELDITVVTIAMPSIQRSLGFSDTGLQWVIDAYLLFFGGFLLLAGRLGDFLGRKRLFLAAMAIFAIGSAANVVAPTAVVLIIGRALQGLAGAMLSPTALALLTETFTEPKERARAMGVWTALQTGSVALGLIVGGVITQALSWRWIFVINLPIAVSALVAAAAALPAGHRERTERFDLSGAVVVTAALTLLVYTFSNAPVWGWSSPLTVALFVVVLVLLAVFLVIERRKASPLVRLGIFKIRSLAVANAGFLLTSAGMYGAFYFASLYVQDVLGYRPLIAGLALLPLTVGVLLGAGLAQVVLGRFGARVAALGGSVLGAGGMVLLLRTTTASAYATTLLPGLLVLAVGLGLAMVPFTLLATNGVAEKESGLASGLYTASSYLGGAVGLAVLAAVAAAHTPHAAGTAQSVSGYHAAYLAAAILLAVAVPLLAVLRHKDVKAAHS